MVHVSNGQEVAIFTMMESIVHVCVAINNYHGNVVDSFFSGGDFWSFQYLCGLCVTVTQSVYYYYTREDKAA